jgi:2'-hydroxyisoflavone reductase
MQRRDFVKNSGTILLAAGLAPGLALAAPRKPMKILVLGGTGFLGPHFVRLALSRGHELTLFNRGRSNTDLFPEVTKLKGDRDGGLQALQTGEWDVVLDNSGYVPRTVKDSAELLKGRVGRYLFTSSISAYDFARDNLPMAPGSRLQVLSEPESEDVGKHYGALKVVCEQAVQEIYGGAATIVRPTYVVGPGDHTQRFTWWVERINRGGDVLAPGNPLTAASLIDVRDLASFFLHLLERDTGGVFNAAGPAGVLTMGGMLNGIRATTSRPVRLMWVPRKFLDDAGVGGREMPLWMAELDGYDGLPVEYQSSMDAGLRFRPLAETCRDTHAWYQQLPEPDQQWTRAGLDPARETALLKDWRQQHA